MPCYSMANITENIKEGVKDSFGKMRIFNLPELLPALICITYAIVVACLHRFSLVDLFIGITGIFVSMYIMFLRLITFVIGITTMVASFLPLLNWLKQNER